MTLNPPHGTIGKYMIPVNSMPVEYLKKIDQRYLRGTIQYLCSADIRFCQKCRDQLQRLRRVRRTNIWGVYEHNLLAIQIELVGYLDLG